MSAGIQLALQNSPEGGQLKESVTRFSPSSASAQKRAFSFYYEQRNVMGTFLKDIRSFHDFQNIYTKKYMDINVYSFPHRLDVMISNVNYLGQCG